MRKASAHALVGAAFSAFFAFGCASTPAAPFNQMPQSQVTALKLQNYEPPAAAAAPAASPIPTGLIPGMPPEIQNWMKMGADNLRVLIPPGLPIPGLGTPAAAPTAAPDTAQRFQGFRILNQTPVMDESLRTELAKILGDADNFDTGGMNCMYPEMGVAFAPQFGAPSNDLLISFSCRAVEARTFQWPHPNRGLKPDTVKKLANVINRVWPGG